VELRTWRIRIDCECGYQRVAHANYVSGRWLPEGNKHQTRHGRYNVSVHSFSSDGTVERIWLECPNPRCNRRYSYRPARWNARMNQAGERGRTTLTLGIDL
jgi:hypothetical protein